MVHNSAWIIRDAKTRDVPAIAQLTAPYVARAVLVDKPLVAYYEALQEFVVAEVEDRVVGCGALHVMWEGLAEVRTLAVADTWRGKGLGDALLTVLLDRARYLEISRVFCLTFETRFFPVMVSNLLGLPRWTRARL